MKHICIDFEGVGRSSRESTPFPTMLGTLIPNECSGHRYESWFFDSVFAPLCRSTCGPKRKEVIEINELALQLVDLCNQLGCGLVHYSHHEAKVLKAHLRSESWRLIHAKLFNIKPPVDRIRRERGYPVRRGQNELAIACQQLSKRQGVIEQPGRSLADTCRRLHASGASHKRWSNWPESVKQLAADFFAYNHADCKALVSLINIVENKYGDSWFETKGVQVQA